MGPTFVGPLYMPFFVYIQKGMLIYWPLHAFSITYRYGHVEPTCLQVEYGQKACPLAGRFMPFSSYIDKGM